MNVAQIKKSKNITFNIENIIKIYQNENTINFLTNEHILHTLHYDLSISNSISFFKSKHTYNAKKNKDFVSIYDNNYAILVNDIIKVLDTNNTLVNTINLKDFEFKDVSSLCLSKTNIFIGFENGKIVSFCLEKNTFIYLPKLRDYIETIYETDKYIIYGSYNSILNILDKETFEIYMTIGLSNAPILSINSINEYKILVQDRTGKVFIIDLPSKTAKYITTITNTILNCAIYNKNICVINTNYNETIFIINFFEPQFKVIQNAELTFIYDHINILKSSENNIHSIRDIDEYITEILSNIKGLLDENTLFDIYQVIENNIFVKSKNDYLVKLDNIYDLFALKAIDLLNNNTPEIQNKKKDMIDRLLNPFRKIKKYDLSLVELKRYSNAFKNFITMYKAENYYMCYELANQYQFLKSTNDYKNLENKFKILFYEIYKNMNNPENYKKLEMKMRPYSLVKEKKKYIEYLNNKKVTIDIYFKSIETKNLKLYFVTLDKNPDFALDGGPLKEYNAIMNTEIKKMYKLTENIENVDVTLKAITTLKDSSEYKAEMEQKLLWITEYQNFIEMYKINKILSYSKQNIYIENSQEFKKIKIKYSHMYKIVQEINKPIASSYIIEKFKPFFSIYEDEIKELIKLQYMKSIYNMLKTIKDVNVSNIVKLYISICGKDYHIQNIIDEYNLNDFANVEKSINNKHIHIKNLPDTFKL